MRTHGGGPGLTVSSTPCRQLLPSPWKPPIQFSLPMSTTQPMHLALGTSQADYPMHIHHEWLWKSVVKVGDPGSRTDRLSTGSTPRHYDSRAANYQNTGPGRFPSLMPEFRADLVRFEEKAKGKGDMG